MNRTAIEWALNPDGSPGHTLNPITGCLNHKDGLCKGGGFPCYAYKLAQTRLKDRYLSNHNVALENMFHVFGHYEPGRLLAASEDPFYPRFWQDKLNEIWYRWQRNLKRKLKPIGCFLCDMGDLLGKGVPVEWTKTVLEAIQAYGLETDRYYLLTKQAERLAQFSPFPRNCWVGVTACNQTMLEKSITHLMGVEAPVRFLSLEPLQGPIDLTAIKINEHQHVNALLGNTHGIPPKPSVINKWDSRIHWIIIGAQTKPFKPPELRWISKIFEDAAEEGVPVFLKNNLGPIIPRSWAPREYHNQGGWYPIPQEVPDVRGLESV